MLAVEDSKHETEYERVRSARGEAYFMGIGRGRSEKEARR
jgi:hypothetical protein